MPHPLKPQWLLQSFQPARCHQALRNLLSSSAEASYFLAKATLLRLSLEGWPSPLAPGGQQLSTCKWENERLHYRCQTAWTPRSYRPAIVHMAFPLQKSGWAQGRLGQASSGGAGLPCEDHFHLLLSTVSSVSSLCVASTKTPLCHQPCLRMSQPQGVFPGSFIALHKSAAKCVGGAGNPRLIPMYNYTQRTVIRGTLPSLQVE